MLKFIVKPHNKMSAADEAQRFDDAPKEHEKQLVIDLGADRLFKWIGVYLFFAFAVIAKFADIIGMEK